MQKPKRNHSSKAKKKQKIINISCRSKGEVITKKNKKQKREIPGENKRLVTKEKFGA